VKVGTPLLRQPRNRWHHRGLLRLREASDLEDPPRYLADYAVRHLELPPRDGSLSSTDHYYILVGNSLHYPSKFHQEGKISDRFSEGTRSHKLSFRNPMEIFTGRLTRTLAGSNSETQGSAIATTATTQLTHNLKVDLNSNFNTSKII